MFSSAHLLSYLSLMLQAVGVTLKLCAFSLILGGTLGFLLGLVRTSKSAVLRRVVTLYVETFRSIPLLILLFLIYYALPVVIGLNLPPFITATVALVLYVSSFMVEIVRAGIESVAKGQREAGLALGLTYFSLMRRIILPQAVAVIIPASVGLFVSTIKDSSLASIIGYVELTRAGFIVREQTYSTMDVLLVMAVLYFAICYPLSRLALYLERRMNYLHALHKSGQTA